MSAPLPPALWGLVKCALCRFLGENGTFVTQEALTGLARTLFQSVHGSKSTGGRNATKRFVDKVFNELAPPYLHSHQLYSIGILKCVLMELRLIEDDEDWHKTLKVINNSRIRVITRNPQSQGPDDSEKSWSHISLASAGSGTFTSSSGDRNRSKRTWSDHESQSQDFDTESIGSVWQAQLEEKTDEISRLKKLVDEQDQRLKRNAKKARVLAQRLRRTQSACTKLDEENRKLKKSKSEFEIARVGSSEASGTWLSPLGNINLAATWPYKL